MSYLCLECKNFVYSRQEALLCDGCNKWQHGKCNSGVTREMYRNAVQTGNEIPWQCKACSTSNVAVLPNFESTRNEDSAASLRTVMEVTMFSEPVSSIMYAAPTAIEESAEPASPPASPRPIESTLFSGASDNATSSVDHSHIQLPEAVEEPSLEDPAQSQPDAAPVRLTYEIVADGTKRWREKLVNSLGYTYNVKERGKVTTYWQCTV